MTELTEIGREFTRYQNAGARLGKGSCPGTRTEGSPRDGAESLPPKVGAFETARVLRFLNNRCSAAG